MSPEGVAALWATGAKSWVSIGEMGENLVRISPTRVSVGEKGELQNATQNRLQSLFLHL